MNTLVEVIIAVNVVETSQTKKGEKEEEKRVLSFERGARENNIRKHKNK